VFLRLWDPSAGKGSRCCSLEDLEDARRVAAKLGILLHEECVTDMFFESVFLSSLRVYAAGLTPNPCVVCNRQIKFAELLRMLDEFDAQVLVTGHYARCVTAEDGSARLLCGVDRDKDQSYFLHRLDQSCLQRVRFPMGVVTKQDARARARAAGLPVTGKPESQELCFVPEGTSYSALLEQWLPDEVVAGDIVDSSGSVLGTHAGVHRYTVGQRRGLGVAASAPLYVLAIERSSGAVIVGPREELEVTEFAATDACWISGSAPAAELECHVKVRSRHHPVPATVRLDGARLIIRPHNPLVRPAPGQAAVLYDGQEVLGGGWIERSRQSTVDSRELRVESAEGRGCV